MDRDNSFTSFLLGLGVGVGIGMLFAPKAGAETRQIIRDRAGEGGEYLKQRSGELKQKSSELMDKGKEALGRQKETINDAIEAGRQAYRDAVGQPPPAEGTAH
jgi:gas vesicle protein